MTPVVQTSHVRHPAVLCVRVGAGERGAGQQHPRRRKERDKERQSLRVPHLGDDQRHFHRIYMVLFSMVRTHCFLH